MTSEVSVDVFNCRTWKWREIALSFWQFTQPIFTIIWKVFFGNFYCLADHCTWNEFSYISTFVIAPPITLEFTVIFDLILRFRRFLFVFFSSLLFASRSCFNGFCCLFINEVIGNMALRYLLHYRKIFKFIIAFFLSLFLLHSKTFQTASKSTTFVHRCFFLPFSLLFRFMAANSSGGGKNPSMIKENSTDTDLRLWFMSGFMKPSCKRR